MKPPHICTLSAHRLFERWIVVEVQDRLRLALKLLAENGIGTLTQNIN